MDIAAAYPTEDIKSLKRSFTTAEDGISMTDEFDYIGDDEITERFVTLTEPAVRVGEVEIGEAVMSFDESLASPVVSTELLSNGDFCYLIDFKLPKGTQKFTVSVK